MKSKKEGKLEEESTYSLFLVSEKEIKKSPVLSSLEKAYVERQWAKGKSLSYFPLPVAHAVVVFSEVKSALKGGSSDEELEKIRICASEHIALSKERKEFTWHIQDESEQKSKVEAFMEGLLLSSYCFDFFKTKPFPLKEKDKSKILSDSLTGKFNFTLESTVFSEVEFKVLQQVCREINRVKYLVDLPFSALNASQLAKIAIEGAEKLKIEANRWSVEKIKKSGMGGLLGVNQGSIDEPSFTELTWKPRKTVNKNPIILIGKGVVFDAGGMNIKTGDYMSDMKIDMAGAAMVLGIIHIIAFLKLPLFIKVLIPSTDNRLNGNALVPGDVITMYNGSTVEMVNTDAEGRLLLADAVAYAQKFKPELIFTMATLTGAATRALGSQGIAVMQEKAEDQVLALTKAGDITHERLCFFPMWKEYEKELESEVADLKNCGSGYAGMITAAKFIAYFTEVPLVHLDVAGVAFLHKKDAYRGIGATATGVRMMVEYFKNYALKK